MTPALRNGKFRRLVVLYTANLLVEWFVSIALMVVVYGDTRSAALAAMLLVAKQAVPGVLLPLVGPTLDRFEARPVLVLLFALQALLSMSLSTASYGSLVFVLAAASGAAGAAIRATLRASIARVLATDELRAGNAFLNVVTGVAAPVGPAGAAAVVALWGPEPALTVAAALMAGLALVSVVARGADQQPAPVAVSSEPSAVAPGDASAPLPVRWLLLVAALIVCVFCMDQPALLGYSDEALGAGVSGYGGIFAAWGIGTGVGTLLFARLLGVPMLRIYVAATIVSAIGLLGMALAPSLAVALAFAVLGGIGNGMDWVAIVTVLQEATPRGHEARTATRLESIGMAAPVAGILLGGFVADMASPRFAVALAGALALAILAVAGGVAAALRSNTALRGMRPSPLPASIPGGSA